MRTIEMKPEQLTHNNWYFIGREGQSPELYHCAYNDSGIPRLTLGLTRKYINARLVLSGKVVFIP